VVCQLDLKGFSQELAVISGRSATVDLMKRLIATYGPAPEDWLPFFYQGAEAARPAGGPIDPNFRIPTGVP
jgi:type IV secretion system protein VirB4